MRPKSRPLILALFALLIGTWVSAPVVLAQDAHEPVRHSFLGVGKANRVVIVGEDGKVEWRLDMPASDRLAALQAELDRFAV